MTPRMVEAMYVDVVVWRCDATSLCHSCLQQAIGVVSEADVEDAFFAWLTSYAKRPDICLDCKPYFDKGSGTTHSLVCQLNFSIGKEYYDE